MSDLISFVVAIIISYGIVTLIKKVTDEFID